MRGRARPWQLLALVLHCGCGMDDPVEVIELSHGLDPSHPVHQAMEFMAERLVPAFSLWLPAFFGY